MTFCSKEGQVTFSIVIAGAKVLTEQGDKESFKILERIGPKVYSLGWVLKNMLQQQET